MNEIKGFDADESREKNDEYLQKIVSDIVELDYEENLDYEEKLRRLDRLLITLHNVVNDPTTRDEMAPVKNQLVYDLAYEFLSQRNSRDWQIQRLVKKHEKTGVTTHNTEVIIGDPKTGPTTVIMVHHDVIFTENKIDGKIPFTDENGNVLAETEYCDENGTIHARTIQDNTIHLSNTLASLHKIEKPKNGAVIVVFTDHEENGCLGSHNYKERLAQLVSPEYPVSLIALESTEFMLGIGHRGKFDGQLFREMTSNEAVENTFADFFAALFATQLEVYNMGEDILGHSTGTSTCGFTKLGQNLKKIWSKLDFRTSGAANPEIVAEIFNKYLQNPEAAKKIVQEYFASIKAQVINNWQNRLTDIEVTEEQIIISSESNLLHPSTFDPNMDQTVLPTTYIVLQAINNLQNEYGGEIHAINWGDENKQNSNPVRASIEGTFNFTDQELIDEIFDLQQANPYSSPQDLLEIDEATQVMTGAVTPQPSGSKVRYLDIATTSILKKLGLTHATMNFMTDIGAPFNWLKKLGFEKIYPFVFGVGEMKWLHKNERLMADDRLAFNQLLPDFINTIQKTMNEHS